ncbi:MAG: hypothetical protein DYG85_02745 [Chloroflexi bacterium CFX1]|nr:hypothetical protein [Chloroflexi bacterium CFX1]MCQ3951828.1 hypothetical protein [Chloroflexota bacterium]MDL1917808.1 hypothetical protein [Chloroflexi bacterium CFX5]
MPEAERGGGNPIMKRQGAAVKISSSKLIPAVVILACVMFASEAPNARAQSDRIVFAVIGDYGVAGQPEADVANLVKGWNPDFIVTTGDNNQIDQSDRMDDNIGQYYHEYLVNYAGKYGEGSQTRRFFPTPGNHDWTSGGLGLYLKYFNLREDERYYEFTQGPVRFFMLNSNREEPDGVDIKSQQAIWLRKALTSSASPFNVVVFHHPPYTSGWHRAADWMRWPFGEWGADIVLTGHNHLYERLEANGLPYITNGLGGAEIYKFESIVPESRARFNQDHGAMLVEATSQYMRFRMFTRAGALVDEYILGDAAPFVSSIARLDRDPSNAGVVNYQATFTDAVTGVDASDFVLTGGAGIANVSGSGNSYVVSVNTGGDGILRLDLADDDSIASSLGLPLGWEGATNGNFSGETYTVDKTPPAILSIARATPSPTNAASVDFVVTFNESVSGVDLADFAISTTSGAALTGINGAGASYIVTVATGNGNDTLRLDFVDNDSILDPAGNTTLAGFSNGESYAVDRAAPVVASIAPVGGADASSVDFAVSFSEPVIGVDGGDFFLQTMNGATITNIAGGGSQYVVSVAIQPGSDSIRLDVADNDSIADEIGNPLGGAGSGNGNFMGGIHNASIATPIVTSIIRASANPTNAATAAFIVTFSEIVEGVDAGDFVLTNGTIRDIQNLSPFFVVNVETGAVDGEMRLDLVDDDSIHNAEGVALGGSGAGDGNFSGEAFTLDRAAPQVASIIRAGNNPTLGPTADFIVTFSEPVLGVESSDFTITGSNVILSSVVNLQNADPFYWVTATIGAGSGTIRLDLFDNGNITDRAGNLLANNGFITGESFTLAKTTVDFSAPVIAAIPGNLTNNAFSPPSWSVVPDARAYEVFIARDSGFSKNVLAQTIEGATLTMQIPLPDGGYYMKVRAYNANLDPGKFSGTYFFTLDATPPAAPALKRPKNGTSTPRRPQLEWKSVGGAARYEVQIDNNADFSSPEFTTTTAKTFVQSKTLMGRMYYWRVRAKDAAGNWSAWSAVLSFNVR